MRGVTVLVAAAAAAAAVGDVEVVDVAVVGAGYAGLAAARVLANAGVDVRVLEARPRPGGRTLNVDVVSGLRNTATDDVVELGGEWLAPAHAHARRLVERDLNFSLFHRAFNALPKPLTIVVQTSDGTRYATSTAGERACLPPLANAEIDRVSPLFEALARTVDCRRPLASAHRVDGASMGDWLRLQNVTTVEARYVLGGYADDAESLESMGFLPVLWTFNCTQGIENSNKEDWFRVRGGTQGPALALADALGDRVAYRSPATAVTMMADGRWAVTVLGGREVVASKVLLAGLPPPVLSDLRFDPELPGATDQLLQRWPMGTSLKYSLVYPTPWWRDLGFLGKIVFADGTKEQGGYVSSCLDNSPESWRRGVLACFVEGDGNRNLFRDHASVEARTAAVEAVVLKTFGVDPRSYPNATLEAAVEHDWAHQRFSRGAYGGWLPSGVLSSFWPELQSIVFDHAFRAYPDGVFVAGADYASVSQGYIDGAVFSGEEAAAKILLDL
jgi:monoamine oxidase